MSNTTVQDPPGFDSLSKADQVRYLQDLWDRILDAPGDIPAPQSHLDLAEARLQQYRSNPTVTKPASEMLDDLSKRAK